MRIASPLRYPGGKTSLANTLGQIRHLNSLGDRPIAEPFAGGAGASLSLLYLEEAREIFINDADLAIFDFWWTLTHRPSGFLSKLTRTRISMAEWYRQRQIYRSSGYQSRLNRGFAAFYLNRCNRSGIIVNGGPIGGLRQEGKWKLNARFNKPDLYKRCKKIEEYKDRIHVSSDDGIDFIRRIDANAAFLFIDPPYFSKGKTLYLNAIDDGYHSELANTLKSVKDAAWVLTYDDCPEIRKLYRGWASIHKFSLNYSATIRRKGNEVLITPKWMRLPTHQTSASIAW